MKKRQIVIGFIAAALAVTGRGQQPSVDQRLEQLEQEIRVLKRQRELDQEASVQKAQESAKTTPTLVAGKDGFALKSADGNFQLKLRGQVQVDGRFFLDDDSKGFTDTFLLRRVRPIVEGTLFKNFDFRLMPDFGGGSTVLQDAYLEWTYWPFAKLRAGKFKPQVGLERLQSDSDQCFMENGFPSALLPARDVGLQLGGDFLGGTIAYAAGIYNGVADGSSGDIETTGEGKEVAARLFVQPFKKTDIEPLQNLGVGVAATYGDQQGSATSPSLPSLKTGGQNTFFSYRNVTGVASNTAFADGQHLRVVPQGYYYWARLGLLGEYALSEQGVTRPTTPSRLHDTLRNTAWQIAGSLLLTDDVASYKGVNPRRPFDPKNGTWGAFELIARFGQLDVDDEALPAFADPSKSASRATAWAVGLNWYLNKNVRAWLDYEQTAFNGGAGTTPAVKDRPDEKALLTRIQLIF
jgi:phosphate-selective porin OprO/OprP